MRHRLAPAVAAAVVVLVVAQATHSYAPLDLVLALVLSPAACLGAGLVARRVAGRRFSIAASWVYTLLPFLGLADVLSTYRHTFVHGALPQLVGLHEPQWLALGVAAAAVAAVAPEPVAAALGVVAVVVALAVWGTGGLTDVRSGLHETSWSRGLAEWVFLAGVVGAALRRPLLGLGIGGWAAAVIVGGSHAGYGHDGEFWRNLAPAAPAIAVLISSIALLLPRLRPARRAASPGAP